MEGKEKALEEKTTKYPVEPSEIRTHEPRVDWWSPYPLRHPDSYIGYVEKTIIYFDKKAKKD